MSVNTAVEGNRKPVKPRKPKAPKVENYYKILGVRANATTETIKKSYIQMVKQFPPEQYSEQFQQIRRAYETLRDPDKRKEYDFRRKYGDSLAGMMDEAFEWMERENWGKAEGLFRKVLDLSPQTSSARLGLAQTMLLQDDLEAFEQQSQMMIEAAESEEEKQKLLLISVTMLLEADRPELALERVERLQQLYPENVVQFSPMLTSVYQALGREEEAFRLIESRIPAVEAQRPDHFSLFIDWINVMIALDKWQYWSKVQPRVKKFLKSIEGDDDLTIVGSALLEQYGAYKENMMLREAELFAEFAYILDSRNEAVRKIREEAQANARLLKAINNLPEDSHLSPIISLKAMEFLYLELGREDLIEHILDTPVMHYFMDRAEWEKDEYIEGISWIKSRYSFVYRRFQARWDALLLEMSSGY